MSESAFAGLSGQLDLLRSRAATSRELVEHALSRIEGTQHSLNAFRCLRSEAALEEADEADRRLAAGERLPLLGVPVAIKDDTDLAGESTAFGCAGEFVRVPAAWTHLVGIKPQRDRVCTWPEAEPFNGLTCIGPLARTVADAAMLLDVVAANHPGEADPPPAAPPAFADAAQREPGRLPRSIEGINSWAARVPDQSLLDPRTRHNARIGGLLGGPVLRAARALERPMRWQLGMIFRRFDVVLSPTTAQPPLPVGAFDGLSGWQTDQAMVAACPYSWPWNAVGWPAINVPAGFTSDGLPVGAQLLGPANAEAN